MCEPCLFVVHGVTPSDLEQSDSGIDDASAYYLYPNPLQILDSCSIALPRGDHIMTGSLTVTLNTPPRCTRIGYLQKTRK
ncbi:MULTISPECIES: hypothetical protein [unclassified Pseudoalteromonas]|uniref:hypothetical protein n=1 Tax=unclassified Pseudoalteromonas TaxID=194690 RepID=UPI00209810EA|nr:hypothetical protein [Pseudoalteromonas sp. XMcav2-N]MCO7186850.1 hypothetical protein [Pseudoalteromonas sp. XMcav2-N]